MRVTQIFEVRQGRDYKVLFTRAVKTKGGGKIKVNLTVLRGYGMIQGIGLEVLDTENENKEVAKKQFYNGGLGGRNEFHKYILYGRPADKMPTYEKDSAVNASIKHHWENLILPCFENQHFADLPKAFEEACKRITHAFTYEEAGMRSQQYSKLISGNDYGGAWELIELAKLFAEKTSGDPKDVLMRILLSYIKKNETSLRTHPGEHQYEQLGNRVLATVKNLKKILKYPELDIVEKSVEAITKPKE